MKQQPAACITFHSEYPPKRLHNLILQRCVIQSAKVWDDENTDANTLNYFSFRGVKRYESHWQRTCIIAAK
ncbi:hypothetical protein [Mixta mediterraneensis]|uniref:hypothetical protein n=1 Tax=Mixta mediterraneensis TaxID=2758443 RepID=UPI0018743834|nr:hypothetical protein [Mixta mediterraneensis]